MSTSRSDLLRLIITDFAPRYIIRHRVFLPRRKLDREALGEIGVPPITSAITPDVVIHDLQRDWLFLMYVTCEKHPIDEFRRNQLSKHFSKSGRHLVLFSVFPDRDIFSLYVESIALQTHVWIADAPDHMIHFNGQRFLGPYPA